jgi:hypothetical protein
VGRVAALRKGLRVVASGIGATGGVTSSLPARLTGRGLSEERLMRELDPELERRTQRRVQPQSECEVIVGGNRHAGVIVDVSRGGVFVRTDARAAAGDRVAVRYGGDERPAQVVHVRAPSRSLRWVATGGLGLRWISIH